MTSKSSFLVNLTENNKRRLWVWVISALIFILAFPVLLLILISQIKSDTVYFVNIYGEKLAEEIIHERLLNTVRQQLGFSVKMVAATGIAVISAVQGFSWLYSRKKIDFYMGMPVKRKKRFFIIWLNGILIYAAPYLLGLLLEMLIAAGNGAVDKAVLSSAVWGFLVNLFFFIGVYHISLLAVMLTGNVIITCFGILVFFLYEFLVRWVLGGYKSFFFRYFDYYNTRTTPVFSPFSLYSSFVTAFDYQNRIDSKNLMGLILMGLATGIIVYLCYRKRPAEAAGKAMAFAVTKPVIKILITIPVSLLAGLMIAQTVGYDPQTASGSAGYMIFTILLVAVIGSGAIQVIYEFDIKGALHKKLHILISVAAAALIFLVFRYDLLRYDAYVPGPEQVESIAFIPQQYEQNMGNAYFDEEGNYLSDVEYADRNMHLHNVEDVCELAEYSIEGYDQVAASYRNSSYDGEELGRWSESTLIYRLKNGRKVCRRLMVNVDDEQTAAVLDRIMGSEEFKDGYMAGASEQLERILEQEEHYKIKASYGNMVYWKDMSRADARELLETYQRDLAGADFSNVRENAPEGMMRLQITEELPGGEGIYSGGYMRTSSTRYIGINIYPFFEESLAYLREQGYYMDYQLDAKDVSYIQVMNRNSETYQRLMKENRELAEDMPAEAEAAALMGDGDGENIDTRVYAEYTGKEEIEQIAACCYPQDFIETYDWDGGVEMDSEYTVYVYFNADSPQTKSYGTSASYGFLKGQIPAFVAGDTAYKE